MKRLSALISAMICFFLFGYFIHLSKFSLNIFLKPVQVMIGIITFNYPFNVFFFFLGTLMLAFGYAFLTAFAEEEGNPPILSFFAVLPLNILFLLFFGFSIEAFVLFLGFSLSAIFHSISVKHFKKDYKHPKLRKIVSNALKTSFIVISIMLAFVMFFRILNNTSTVDILLNDTLSGINTFASSYTQSLKQNELNLAYMLLNNIENSLKSSANYTMSPECADQLYKNINTIDILAKREIKKKIEKQNLENNVNKNMIATIKKSDVYPKIYKMILVTIPITIFGFAQMYKSLLLSWMAMLLAIILDKVYGISFSEEERCEMEEEK